MASPSPTDRTQSLIALLLLPLNFHAIVHRTLLHPNGRRARHIRPSIVSALLIPLFTILVFSEAGPPPATGTSANLEDMKIRIIELESLLEEKTKVLNFKILQLEQSMKMIREMDKKIESVQKLLNDAKKLWDESRRNNFYIHVSESKTHEAGKKVEVVTSKVEKMQSIVNEQWIQIQQLEQSLQLTKVMKSRVNKKTSSTAHGKSKFMECPMLKLRRGISRYAYSETVRLPDSFFLGGTISRSSLFNAKKQFKRIMLAAQNKHHELQYSVKQAMERTEYTALLANNEVVFFVASAIVILPCMMAWVLCSAFFN